MKGWSRHLEFAYLLLLSMALGCSHLVQIPVEDELGLREQRWGRIGGFTRSDGTEVEVDGFATVARDSFLISAVDPALVPSRPPRLMAALPLSEVLTIHVREPDPKKTVTTIATVVLVATLFATLIISQQLDPSH